MFLPERRHIPQTTTITAHPALEVESGMGRCGPRALNADQHHVLTYALLGDSEPWRNSYNRETDDCTVAEQLVRMRLLTLKWEVPGYRCSALQSEERRPGAVAAGGVVRGRHQRENFSFGSAVCGGYPRSRRA